MAEAAKARPASTILLLRDSAEPDGNGADDKGRGEIEVFMMVRHYEIDFNSGALVFPGGSVDAGDHDIAGKPDLYAGGEGLDAQALGFRIAAMRKLSVASSSPPPPEYSSGVAMISLSPLSTLPPGNTSAPELKSIS